MLELLRRQWGSSVTIEESTLLADRLSLVSRLRLGGAAPRSVVVKQVAEGVRPYPEFSEELLVNLFLRESGAWQGLAPELLAWDDRTLVFEDLGAQEQRRFRTYGELTPRLARAFARLHGRTHGAYDRYVALRGAPPSVDERRGGTPAIQKRFELGCDFLVAQIHGGRAKLDHWALLAELEAVRRRIEEPGRFRALVHDDCANQRQTLEAGDDLYLIDFELARYAHLLLDLCKPMLGKFETRVETRAYHWVNPAFGHDLAAAHRAELPMQYSDAEWHAALASALAYHALTLIGRLMRLEPARRLYGTIPQNINGILYRLLQLLAHRPELPRLSDFAGQYLGLAAVEAVQRASRPA